MPYPFPHGPLRHPEPLSLEVTFQFGRLTALALRFRQVRPGEGFTILDGTGAFFRCRLTGLGGKGGEAIPYESMAASPESPAQIHLFCAFLARQRMLFISQKATELGAVALHPLFTASSLGAGDLEHEKAHAWQAQAIRAARQCRRAAVPLVSEPQTLEDLLVGSEALAGCERRYFLDVPSPGYRRETGSTHEEEDAVGEIALFAGPEGGWGEGEAERLIAAGCRPLILGGRVLRAETAVLVALTLLQNRFGDLGFSEETHCR